MNHLELLREYSAREAEGIHGVNGQDSEGCVGCEGNLTRDAHPPQDATGVIPLAGDSAGSKEGPSPPPPALYVSMNLAILRVEDPTHYARDIGIYGTAYRRLDPEYYAWLRHKMEKARMATDSGRLDRSAFAKLVDQFNGVHDWAVEHFGDGELEQAARSLVPKTYTPPSMDAINELCGLGGPGFYNSPNPFSSRPAAHVRPCGTPSEPPEYQGHVYPTEGTWRALRPVGEDALQKVHAIRDQAISLGWSHAQLYQNRGNLTFPCGQDYGLVCHLESGERVGQVTRQSIEIVGPPPRETITRFYNWEVEQPWMKRTSKSQ